MLRLAFMIWLALATCHAALLQILDLNQLTKESSAVVHGRIEASRVEWNTARTRILTVYTVRAERYLKGFLGPTFELTEPGGELHGLAMRISGAPHFRLGEEAVLFVWTDGVRGRQQAIGFEQGVFRVRRDPRTGMKLLSRSAPLQKAGEVTSSGRGAGAVEGRTDGELSRFLAQVSQAVERTEGVRQ